MSPVLYLDIDGVLLRDVPPPGSGPEARYRPRDPAPGAGEFLRWATERFEVRWLTDWAPSGRLAARDTGRLAKLFDVEASLLAGIEGHPWDESKIEGIDLDDPRPWVWVDDGPGERALEELRSRGLEDRWIECRSDLREDALSTLRETLADRAVVIDTE